MEVSKEFILIGETSDRRSIYYNRENLFCFVELNDTLVQLNQTVEDINKMKAELACKFYNLNPLSTII